MVRLLFGICIVLGLLPRTSVSAECDLAAMVDNCLMSPLSVKYRWLKIGLCKGTPILPTLTTPLDDSNCQLLYNKFDDGGKVIEWSGPGDYGELSEELSIPANGTYDHLIFAIGRERWVKFEVEFPTAMKTLGSNFAVSSGKYCRTIDGVAVHPEGWRHITLECGEAYQESEYSLSTPWPTGGIDSGCVHWDGRFIAADRTLSSSREADAVAYLAVIPMSPVKVSSDTSLLELNWAFDQQYRIDTDTSSEPSGWFMPRNVCPSFGISAQ